MAGLVAMLKEGHFCGGIGGYVGRWPFLWRDWWLCWEKGIFVTGLMATLGEGHLWRYWWLRLEKGISCGGIGGYSGRRAFLWRD